LPAEKPRETPNALGNSDFLRNPKGLPLIKCNIINTFLVCGHLKFSLKKIRPDRRKNGKKDGMKIENKKSDKLYAERG
jgi:hypothetical protein